MSATPLSSSPASATGRPALTPPFGDGYRSVLILRGQFAQHVAIVTERKSHGRVKAVIEYGHSADHSGKVTLLNSGDYVGTDSPTCPALPRRS